VKLRLKNVEPRDEDDERGGDSRQAADSKASNASAPATTGTDTRNTARSCTGIHGNKGVEQAEKAVVY